MEKKNEELSILQARLLHRNRPVHIYFQPGNRKSEELVIQPDGTYSLYYPNRGTYLPLHGNGSPALYYEDGSQFFLEYGRFHRWNGPAIHDATSDISEYWLNGVKLTKEEYAECKEYDIWPISWSPEGKIIYVKRNDPYCKHRISGPAKITFSGQEEYYEHGVRVYKSASSLFSPAFIVGVIATVGALSVLNKEHASKQAYHLKR